LHVDSFLIPFVGLTLKVWLSTSRVSFGSAGSACFNLFNFLPELFELRHYKGKRKNSLGTIKSNTVKKPKYQQQVVKKWAPLIRADSPKAPHAHRPNANFGTAGFCEWATEYDKLEGLQQKPWHRDIAVSAGRLQRERPAAVRTEHTLNARTAPYACA